MGKILYYDFRKEERHKELMKLQAQNDEMLLQAMMKPELADDKLFVEKQNRVVDKILALIKEEREWLDNE